MVVRRCLVPLSLLLILSCSAVGNTDKKAGFRDDYDESSEIPGEADEAPTLADAGPSEAGSSFEDDDESSLGDAGTDVICNADRHETTRHPVDIVFVVDNSGSMSDEITQLKANINNFASTIANSGLDYRLFMIGRKGAGKLDVCIPEPLANPGCATKPPRFYAIDKVISSTNALVQLLATYDDPAPADPFSAWHKFVRFDSKKVFVAITDDNSSLKADAFETQLFQKAPTGIFGSEGDRKYIFDSIIGWDGINDIPTAKKCTTAANAGLVYQELSLRTGGVVESICKEDWSGIFGKIADGVVKELGCEFQVPDNPEGELDPGLVEVQLTLGGGAPTTLPRVLDEGACSQEPGAFYFDSNTAPTEVKLCPGVCSQVGADPQAEVSVLVGCPAPPPR